MEHHAFALADKVAFKLCDASGDGLAYDLVMSWSRPIFPITDAQVIEAMHAGIEKSESSGPGRAVEKFVLAALSSIPWFGILVSTVTSMNSEEEAAHQSYLLQLWVEEHRRKLTELAQTLQEVQSRFENFGEK